MKVTIHQSICGEVNKAWGLIKTTLPDVMLAKSIAFRTDLQDQTSGIHWNPAIRGFSEGDYYLIMKTFEDTDPDVRSGRKFSHVLIIPKKEIVEFSNLEQIINLLPEEIDKEQVLEPISIEDFSDTSVSITDKMMGRLTKLINGYANIKTYKNILIWIGQEDFNIAVIELWKRLTVAERQNFQFGITFNNEDKKSDGINLIAVPESVQSKFVRSEFFTVGKNDSHKPTELIEQLLIGNKSTQQRIDNFEKTIGSKPLSREDISLVAKGIDTFEQIGSIKDLKKLNTLSHIIAQYASSEKQGIELKKQLLNEIIQLAESVSFSDLNVLRNFKTDSFQNSEKLLSAVLKSWMHKHILSVKNNSAGYTSFFEQVKEENLNWWDKVITQELKAYLGTIQPSKMSVIYSWLEESETILASIKSFIEKSQNTESLFIKQLPKKASDKLIAELKKLSIENNWLRLYAHLLNRKLEFSAALTELFKIDQDENHFEAVEVIVTGKKEKLIIDYAVDRGESRMIKIAGVICNKTSKHLAGINVLNINWQLIWIESIKNGNQVASGLKEPEKEVHKLFDHIIDGNSVSEVLMDKISLSEFGNLLTYPNMTDLWEKLSESVKNNFLMKTSAAFLEGLSKTPGADISNDNILSDYTNNKGIADFLYVHKNNIKLVLPVFEKFFQLTDNHLRDYLNNFFGQINAVEAKQLGRLIANRSFSNSSHLVRRKADKNNNWRFALLECHQLLDTWTNLLLSFSGILSSVDVTSEHWWKSAEELIVELYPNGTSLTTIWKKAGGKESDLLSKGTSSEIWSDAFYKLRKNLFDNITMNDLLKECKKQYGDNQKFKIIYELRKNFI